ncbi:hypothetical protein TRICI_002509 [Trichomonascus ciferrii]|uniref:Heat shock transcription factor n=1 Tax=Trichomonascus ciferrii TaxID=44093 RepID=A0A642V6M4_9ASCO|nr:hypothetical protein TRICI_002509 [Trichomonascus ciferrii]
MPKNRPPFVEKVWSLVNDPSNHEYINWMPDGESFYIVDKEGFEREILPKYFKHCKFSSFIRQLNMYGWHKVLDINSGAINSKETWQFKSPYFLRDREDLLDNIVRNSSGGGGGGGNKDADHGAEDGHSDAIEPGLKADVSMLKRVMGEEILRLKKENQLLWQENLQHRENFEKIFRFLASVYGNQVRLPFDVNGTSTGMRNQRLLTQNPDSENNAIATDDTNNAENKISQIIELNTNGNSPKSSNSYNNNNDDEENNSMRDESLDMTNQLGNLDLQPTNLLPPDTSDPHGSKEPGANQIPHADSVIQSITGSNDFLNHDGTDAAGNMPDIGLNFDDFIIDPSYAPNDSNNNSLPTVPPDDEDTHGALKRKRTA